MRVEKKEKIDALSNKIIGAAIEIHKTLGPGLLESVYEECLCSELSTAGMAFEKQVPLPVVYKGVTLECGYRLDMVVDKTVILEIKSVESILPVHEAQLLTYLKLSRLWQGMILNFNVSLMKNDIKRIVHGF